MESEVCPAAAGSFEGPGGSGAAGGSAAAAAAAAAFFNFPTEEQQQATVNRLPLRLPALLQPLLPIHFG